MTSKVLRGILNGDSIPKIADSLTAVIGNNMASATRNARTMTTSAENGGRLDSYKNLADQGVIQKKIWTATPDDRTRESHRDIDGEEQDIDVAFSNGCMYPGDGNGPAEEVWNCRCSMKDKIIGFRRADGSISKVEYQRDRIMHDDQMEATKAVTKKERIIPTTAQELSNKWSIPVSGLQGEVITNIDDALEFMQSEFGVDPKEYITMFDKNNPDHLRGYKAYYSPYDNGIHFHKEFSGGKNDSLSPDECAHEIMHAINGYLSQLETKNHNNYKLHSIADEIITKVYSENGYVINKRTGLPSKEIISKTITKYASVDSAEALADSAELVYKKNVMGLKIVRENDMHQKVYDEVKRRLRDDIK